MTTARAAGWLGAATALLALASATSCTSLIPAGFNAGGLDTARDPERGDRELQESIVRRFVEEHLVGAYFSQGADRGEPACATPRPFSSRGGADHVAPLLLATVDAILATRPVLSGSEDAGEPASDGGPPPPRPSISDALRRGVFCALASDASAPTTASCGPAVTPVCADASVACNAGGPSCSMMRVADLVRETRALLDAADALASAVERGLADRGAVERAVPPALQGVRTYLDGRYWRRPPIEQVCTADHHAHVHVPAPVVGLAIKGGASTGIFSAGIVWTVLNLLHACNADPLCGASAPDKAGGYRIQLVSGTSTGAMIATAVDRYFAAKSLTAKAHELGALPRWFTCYSLTDLMCAQDAPITWLAEQPPDALTGVLKFDGIARILARCAEPALWTNETELLLNTVDFRTGRLFSLSDQGELHERCAPVDSLVGVPKPPRGLTPCPLGQYNAIVGASVASAELPLIGQPETRLPTTLAPAAHLASWTPDGRVGTFLDGGIRSELPVLPLVRRGAERALVVGSSAALLAESRQQKNALDVGARYIDIETGAVTEEELEHSDAYARSERLSEIALCKLVLANQPDVCNPASCDADAFCEARFNAACAPAHGDGHPKSAEVLVGQSWKELGLFRDELRVAASSGYSFVRGDMQRLFRGGMEAARAHCAEIADLFGMPWRSKAMREKLAAWCTPPFPTGACGRIPEDEHPKLRTCSDPPKNAKFMDVECSEGLR